MKGIVLSEDWFAEMTTGEKAYWVLSLVSSPLPLEVSAIWQDPSWNGAIDRR